MASQELTDSLRETLALFPDSTPRSTPEVAEALDLGRRSTYERLERLADHGRLETKKVGASARVWWRPSAAETDEASPSTNGDIAGDGERVDSDERTDDGERTDSGERMDSGERTGNGESPADRQRAEERDAAADGEPTTDAVGDLDGHVWIEDDVAVDDSVDHPQFESLVAAVEEYAIFTLDPDGYVRSWNPGARRIKGYEAAEILGEHFSVFYTEDDVDAGVPERNLERAAEQGEIEDEGWRVRADGTEFWAKVTITAIYDDDGTLEGFAKVTQDLTERREHERKLREEVSFTQSILENQRDLIYAFDETGKPVRWNDRVSEILGYEPERIARMDVTDFIAEEATAEVAEAVERVLGEGERVTIEVPLVTADGETIPYEVTASPMLDGDGEPTGFTGIGRDVSERKEKERRLERRRDELAAELEDVFDRIADGFVGLDEDLRFTYVNDRAAAMLDVEEPAVLGRKATAAIELSEGFVAALERALDSQEAVTHEAYYEPMDAWVESAIYPSETGLSVYFRDVTVRKEREQELELYETLFEESRDVNAVLDSTGEFEYVTPSIANVLGHDPADVVGQNAFEFVHPEDREWTFEEFAAMLEDPDYEPTVEFRFVDAEGDWAVVEARARNLLDDPDIEGIVVYTRDVTERRERERMLERRVRQQQVVADLGQDALETRDLDGLMADAAELVADVLDNDYCKVLDLDPDADELLLRQGVGWQEGIVGHGTVSAVEDDSQAAYTLHSKEPVVVTDLDTEDRFSGPDLLRDHDVKSGISTIIGPFDEPWGILGTHDTESKDISEHDVNFVQSVATILATAIERQHHEEQLLEQRERLAALNGLNEVVRNITDAVIERSTREEIEQAVCDGLAGSDSFSFAWIGEVDSGSRTVAVRTEAGVDGYLDDVTISVDPADEHSRGPTGRALRTGEIQVTQDVHRDEDYEPWQDHAEDYDVYSSAAIPILHEGTTYGVLNVYAERPNAFTGEERAVLSQLGEVVGHAIAAIERKRALMSDEVVELEFQLPNVFDAVGIDVGAEGWMSLDEAVPAGENDYLIYGRATFPVEDVLAELVGHIDHWEDYDVIAERDGNTRFEARLSEPPILSAIASRGGHVEEAVIDASGDYSMRVHLPPSVSIRSITEVVQEAYPTAELLAQRQLSNTGRSTEPLERLLHEDLTDRQRSVLAAAYHAGFFEWPRENNGEHVAESLGVSSPTFHQHLRKAEGKVFDSLFSAGKVD